jgi:hypothetical protein
MNESVTGAGPGPMHFGEGVPRIFVVRGGKSGLKSVRDDIPRKSGSQSAVESPDTLAPFRRILDPLIVAGADGRWQEEAGLSISL